jgi:N-hydroxyarylamine O-acetyltransferase
MSAAGAERRPAAGPDLAAYFERIALAPPAGPPDPATLAALHAAHLEAVPFENLDQRLGRPVGLDLASLEDKIVRRRRGGYCFEQNTLFAAVLRALGFAVDTLEARVRPPGATATLPRTHMVLRVRVGGDDWLADVGFGGDGPLLPVPFRGVVSEQGDERYAIAEEDGGALVLRGTIAGEWRDLYAFRPEPALPVDFEVAHHFTATHPRSVFRNVLTVQRTTRRARHRLRGRSYERTGGVTERRADLGDEEVHDLVVGPLGLDVPIEDVRAALRAE